MPCSSRIISEMLPEIHKVEKLIFFSVVKMMYNNSAHIEIFLTFQWDFADMHVVALI